MQRKCPCYENDAIVTRYYSKSSKRKPILSCYDRNENKMLSIINRNIMIDSLRHFLIFASIIILLML